MTAPRVLHIVQGGDRGGVQRHVRDLAQGLAPMTAGVMTGTGGWLVDGLQREGIATVVEPSLRRAINPVAVAAAGTQARRAAAALQANVVHAHGVFALLAARSVRHLPLVYTAHGFQWHDPAHPAWVRYASRQMHRHCSADLADFIAVSTQDAQDALLVGIPEARVHHIPNGVVIPPHRSRPEAPLRTVGTACRLVPGKGVERLLQFVTLLPTDVALLVAGTGPALPSLQTRARSLGLADRVQWLGWQDDLSDFYASLGVYASLSSKEGMPYSLLDAMAHGLPIVASSIPAHRDILTGRPWAVLVEPGQLIDASVLVRAWLATASRWKESSEAAREDAIARFSLARMTDAVGTVYERLGTVP